MVQTVKVADQRELVNAVYYGDGGTGKTTALASMANLGRVLYIDAEAGVKRRPLEAQGVEVGNIEVLVLPDRPSFTQLEDAYWEVKADLDDDPGAWAGVVWDSGTEIHQAFIEQAVTRRVKRAETAKNKGATIQEILLDRFFIDQGDYGVMTAQIRDLLRRYRDLPCHFGMSFLERRDTDKDSGRIRIGPAVTPGLQNDVIGNPDVVCHTMVEAGVFVGIFQPDGVKVGKDRYGTMPVPLVDPTFDRVVAYAQEELTASTDPRQAILAEEVIEGTDDDSTKPTAKELLAQRRATSKGSKGSTRSQRR